MPQLDEETRALVTAPLAMVNGHIPTVVTKLSRNELPLAKQREFAELRIGLGALLNDHARHKPSKEPIHP